MNAPFATDAQRTATDLPARAAECLQQVFGFRELRPGQQEVICCLLEGRSALAIFPTGAGKSLCYQLPALVLDGLTVVVSPLIALMKDQIDFLNRRGVAAARLDSSLSREENVQVHRDLRAGRIRLLYVSPERLANERFLQLLQQTSIALLAVDEAHCISEWGHNFRPDYLRIASLARSLGVPRVLALTATATPEVASDVAEAFAIDPVDIVQTGFYRPNLHLHATPCNGDDRREVLLRRLNEQPPGPAVVYVTLQKTAEQVAAWLSDRGHHARAYHAGMRADRRAEIQDEFMAADRMVVVATIAFGMGIDKSNIRAVYHYNLPKGLESYMQEIGRAGRDGEVAHCEILASADDVTTLQNFSYGDTPTREAIAGLVEAVLGPGEEQIELALHALSAEYDVRELVVKTLLTYLELDGVLQSTGVIYTQYRFQPVRSSAEILQRFDPQRAEFIASVFKLARRGKTWFSLDVADVAQRLRQPRERVIAALDYLDQQGDLVLQASGVQHKFRLLAQVGDREALVESLAERFDQREQHDLARIEQVIDFVETSTCLTQSLLAYFGQQQPACGHCGRCQGAAPQPLARTARALSDADRQAIAQVAAEGHAALAAPRQLARFLCGVSSPAVSKARLRSHRLFGCYSAVPFAEVLSVAEQVRSAG